MDFSANHKTVLLLERGAYQLGDSGVEHDLNKLIKSRGDVGFPPLRKVTKSVWTCTVVSSMEYARMVWDIYPGEFDHSKRQQTTEITTKTFSSADFICCELVFRIKVELVGRQGSEFPRVLLLERGAYQLGDSGVEHDLNKLIKSRGDVGFPPLRKVTKSVWTCTVVSSMEYARMVWDIYPGEKLVMSTFAEVFRNQEVGVPDSGRALKAALGSLCYSTEAQKARLPASALPANRGRIVYFTHINNCGEVKKLKQTFQRAISDMRASEHDATLLSVDSCDLVVINVNKADEVSKAPDEKCELGPNCSFSLTAVSAVSLVDRVRCFAMEHFDLASLTVTGIPMKEEHHSNASTNYDVEVFYPKIAHRGQDKVDLQNTHKKSGYETLKLRWVAPPRGDANLTIPCHSVSRVTFAEVFSRPSNCLTNFIISGRVVMLEALMKDGSHSMSHMLSSRGGEIFIHSVMDRADNDDVACLTEGVGGKLTDYRSQVLKNFFGGFASAQNILWKFASLGANKGWGTLIECAPPFAA
ncbi:unnamed protein product [Notodromas monacha]|uniref:Protein asunder n=1 Tax=Notodromas monacha TaxID=399045 RepID=A0A7R9BSE9_9CRUS|nr:unnamed protein product [Notodromas monacha]CAG0919832.1 unnamed protein product [Notodromas monacha]